MRTTVTLDDDVVALIEDERRRTGESFRAAVNRLLRRGARPAPWREAAPLPRYPGRPLLDVADVSRLLSVVGDDRRAERDLP
jgi:hypothetical protein